MNFIKLAKKWSGENRTSSYTYVEYRAVGIRFGVVRLVVHVQEHYTLGKSGGMLPKKI